MKGGAIAAAAAAVLVLGLAGCEATTQTYDPITVIEGGDGVARICLDGVTGSEPPTCDESNPGIFAWDWLGLEHQEAGGVRWGSYRIVGEAFGDMFMMVEPPSEPS